MVIVASARSTQVPRARRDRRHAIASHSARSYPYAHDRVRTNAYYPSMAAQVNSPITVGIAGAGFAAGSHLDALRRLPNVQLTGVLASSPQRSAEAAKRLDVDPIASLDQLLEADVVHNCTPNDVHASITEAALTDGVHVLSEKPLAYDASEAAKLAETASGAGVITGVCFNYRHFPLVQELRGLLSGGGDGPVHLVHGAYLQDWLLRPDDWNWRLDSARAGNSRATGDIGSHWIDLAQHVTGDVITSVTARLGTLFAERIRPPEGDRQTFATSDGRGSAMPVDTEDMAVVLFKTRSGVLGSVTISQVSAGRKNHLVLEVDAAESSFVWDQEQSNDLRIGRRDGANRDVLRDPSQLRPEAARLAHFPAGHQEGWPDALRNLFIDFYAAVEAHRRGESYEPTFASFDEAARVQATVEAVVRSSASGTWVDVDQIVQEVSA
jgi:predicted dehydrogenase